MRRTLRGRRLASRRAREHREAVAARLDRGLFSTRRTSVRPVDVAQAAALLEHERNHRPGRWAYGRKAALAMDLLRAYARSTHLRKVVGSRRTIAMQQRSHAFIPNPDTIRGAWRKTCLLVMTPRTMQLRHRRGGFVTTQSKVATLAAPSRDAEAKPCGPQGLWPSIAKATHPRRVTATTLQFAPH